MSNVLFTTNQLGFTLIELLIIVVIIGVIAVIAYPSIADMLRRMEAKKVESIIHSSLRESRTESHITKQNIIICPANEFNICDKRSGKKVIVFRDINNDAQLSNGALIREYDLNLKHGRLDMRVSLSRDYIKYFGSSATPRGHFGHIKYCSTSSDVRYSYKIIVTHLGLVRKTNDDVGC